MFDHDMYSIRSSDKQFLKIVCPKCHEVNSLVVCSLWIFFVLPNHFFFLDSGYGLGQIVLFLLYFVYGGLVLGS